MSSRTVFRPHNVITAGTMAGSLTSQVTILQSLSKVSYSFSWTGTTPIGTVSCQMSNDYKLDPSGVVLNAGTWNTIPLIDDTGAVVTTLPVTGNTGTGFIDVDTAGYASRVIYTRSSGTGAMTVIVNGKVA